MNFNSLSKMIDYINENTKYCVIKKEEYKPNEFGSWIFSEAGKKLLNKNGFFHKVQLAKKIKMLYNNCDEQSDNLTKFYAVLLNAIKNA